jgi:two-component system NarL family sensor kinase
MRRIADMQLRLKLLLLSGVPIVVALALMAATLQHQTMELVRVEQSLVETAFMQSKEAEVKHYVELARNVIARMADAQGPVEQRKAEAIATLTRMQFGQNGYFFVYDEHGKPLIQPREVSLQGVELCDPDDLADPAGADAARLILATARRGGGVVRYTWHKPSSQAHVPKLAHVLPIPRWDWVIGSGIYLDDVQGTLKAIETGARANINGTRWRIFGIAALCVVLIGIGGLALNLKDQRVAADKLRHLARRVVHSQEQERLRVARELHDGVVQVLASAKFLLETALFQLSRPATGAACTPQQALDQGLTRLDGALVEIRRVSHGLRPALLDDLGLEPALTLLVEQMREEGSGDIRLVCHDVPAELPADQGTALFRIAQEALHNARAHAGARRVYLVLRGGRRGVQLSVTDDGRGFDTKRVFRDGRRGIGLRNMRERAEGLGGTLLIHSSEDGTRIEAYLPLSAGPALPNSPPAPA